MFTHEEVRDGITFKQIVEESTPWTSIAVFLMGILGWIDAAAQIDWPKIMASSWHLIKRFKNVICFKKFKIINSKLTIKINFKIPKNKCQEM